MVAIYKLKKMSTTVIINPKTRLGEAINPYPPITGQEHISEYELFFQENATLPVVTAAGETLIDGRYECEKVWQYEPQDEDYITWVDCSESYFNSIKRGNEKAHPYHVTSPIGTREVYRVIRTPELPVKETTLNQHTAEIRTLMEGKEKVDEAAEEYYWSNEALSLSESDERVNQAFIAGANWQKEHSIDREKVISEIEKRIAIHQDLANKFHDSNQSKVDCLTDLLQIIKKL